MIIAGFILSWCPVYYYFPGFMKNLFLSVVGTFAMVFGLFSIMLGFYRSDEPGDEKIPSQNRVHHDKPGEKITRANHFFAGQCCLPGLQMSMTYDVIVAGAGPAGSAAAQECAQDGA